MLQQDVLPGHAHVRRAALHVDGHVRGLHPEVAHPRGLVFEDQLAVRLQDRRALIARRREHGVDLFAQPPLGEGDVDNGFQACTSIASQRMKNEELGMRNEECRQWRLREDSASLCE